MIIEELNENVKPDCVWRQSACGLVTEGGQFLKRKEVRKGNNLA